MVARREWFSKLPYLLFTAYGIDRFELFMLVWVVKLFTVGTNVVLRKECSVPVS